MQATTPPLAQLSQYYVVTPTPEAAVDSGNAEPTTLAPTLAPTQAPTQQLLEQVRQMDPALVRRIAQQVRQQVSQQVRQQAPQQTRTAAALLRRTRAPPGGPARSAQALYSPGDAALSVNGRIPPVVTKMGKRAYEVTLKKGIIHGKGSNVHCNLVPRQFFPAEQCRFSFKVWFDDNFPWGTDMKKVGGKLLGFRIGTGDASGGNYSPTAASFRLTWNYNGGVGPYLYPQVASDFKKGGRAGDNIGWDLLDQSEEVKAVSSIATGVHVFYPKDRKKLDNWELQLRKGAWNDIELFCKLNTPGRKDGTLEVTVNGVTKRLNSVRFRNDTASIEGVNIHTFFGGGTKDYAPPQDTRIWYSDFGFSRA